MHWNEFAEYVYRHSPEAGPVHTSRGARSSKVSRPGSGFQRTYTHAEAWHAITMRRALQLHGKKAGNERYGEAVLGVGCEPGWLVSTAIGGVRVEKDMAALFDRESQTVDESDAYGLAVPIHETCGKGN